MQSNTTGVPRNALWATAHAVFRGSSRATGKYGLHLGPEAPAVLRQDLFVKIRGPAVGTGQKRPIGEQHAPGLVQGRDQVRGVFDQRAQARFRAQHGQALVLALDFKASPGSKDAQDGLGLGALIERGHVHDTQDSDHAGGGVENRHAQIAGHPLLCYPGALAVTPK
jgi:hypothetical protein